MDSLPVLFTWALALAGGILSLAATLGRALGRLGPGAASLLNLAGYACMGLSVAVFAARGFLE